MLDCKLRALNKSEDILKEIERHYESLPDDSKPTKSEYYAMNLVTALNEALYEAEMLKERLINQSK